MLWKPGVSVEVWADQQPSKAWMCGWTVLFENSSKLLRLLWATDNCYWIWIQIHYGEHQGEVVPEFTQEDGQEHKLLTAVRTLVTATLFPVPNKYLPAAWHLACCCVLISCFCSHWNNWSENTFTRIHLFKTYLLSLQIIWRRMWHRWSVISPWNWRQISQISYLRPLSIEKWKTFSWDRSNWIAVSPRTLRDSS